MLGGDTAGGRLDGFRTFADREHHPQAARHAAPESGGIDGTLAVVASEPQGEPLQGTIGEAPHRRNRPHLALAVAHVLQDPGQPFRAPEDSLSLIRVPAVGLNDRDHHAGAAIGRPADRDGLGFGSALREPKPQGERDPGACVRQAFDRLR